MLNSPRKGFNLIILSSEFSKLLKTKNGSPKIYRKNLKEKREDRS